MLLPAYFLPRRETLSTHHCYHYWLEDSVREDKMLCRVRFTCRYPQDPFSLSSVATQSPLPDTTTSLNSFIQDPQEKRPILGLWTLDQLTSAHAMKVGGDEDRKSEVGKNSQGRICDDWALKHWNSEPIVKILGHIQQCSRDLSRCWKLKPVLSFQPIEPYRKQENLKALI